MFAPAFDPEVVYEATDGLEDPRLPVAQLPPGHVPEEIEFVLQITALAVSPASLHPTLNETAPPAVTGSGESETEVMVGGLFWTVNEPAELLEQRFAESQANA